MKTKTLIKYVIAPNGNTRWIQNKFKLNNDGPEYEIIQKRKEFLGIKSAGGIYAKKFIVRIHFNKEDFIEREFDEI